MLRKRLARLRKSARKILAVIGTAAGIATILSWAETSEWLPTWAGVVMGLPWGSILGLTILALVLIGLWQVEELERRFAELAQSQTTAAADVARLSGELQAVKAEIGKLHVELDERINRLGRSIGSQLTEMEKHYGPRLAELGQRLSRLERLPTTARERQVAKAMEAHETEPYPMADGAVWTRRRLDALPEEQREKLFEENPALGDWWLGKPR